MSPEAAAIEAILFVSDEPIGALALAGALELDLSTVDAALHELAQSLEESESGIVLNEIAGGWRLLTHPLYHDVVQSYVLSWDSRHLTTPSLEVLAIVAYAQPVTRAAISEIRGVNSDSPLRSLVDKGLVAAAGTENTPGNPATYATTRAFLEHFGLNTLDDLPPISDFAASDETRKLIAERLALRGIAVEEMPSGAQSDSEAQASAVDLDAFSFDFDDE